MLWKNFDEDVARNDFNISESDKSPSSAEHGSTD